MKKLVELFTLMGLLSCSGMTQPNVENKRIATIAPNQQHSSQMRPALKLDGEKFEQCKQEFNFEPTISALVVNNPELLEQEFSLRKVMGKIVARSAAPSTSVEDVLESMTSSFEVTSHHNFESGLSMPVDARPGEAALTASEILETFKSAMQRRYFSPIIVEIPTNANKVNWSF